MSCNTLQSLAGTNAGAKVMLFPEPASKLGCFFSSINAEDYSMG